MLRSYYCCDSLGDYDFVFVKNLNKCWKNGDFMDISLILKIAGIGMIVAVVSHILSKAGRDDQAGYVSIAGIILALILLVEEIGGLIEAVRGVFGI